MIPEFWSLFLKNWRTVLGVDLLFALVGGVLVGILPENDDLLSNYSTIMATAVGITIGLLGLVLAALSVVIAFLSARLLAFMERTERGLVEDVWPFSFTALLAICTSVTAMFFLIATPRDNELLLRITAGVVWALFFWTLTSTFALIRVVYEYGRVRATDFRNEEEKDSPSPD
jgi:hypothetical protein